MSRLIERGAMSLARIVAGPHRREWLDAMEGELETLHTKRLDWALGSLVAAIKDRGAREWRFGVALGLLPGLALIAIIPVTVATGLLTRLLGAPEGTAMLGLLLTPLPFAYLLGRARPQWNALAVGASGFAIHQLAPVIVWKSVIGPGILLDWGPNLWWLRIPQSLHLSLSLSIWIAGAWLGTLGARARKLRHLS